MISFELYQTSKKLLDNKVKKVQLIIFLIIKSIIFVVIFKVKRKPSRIVTS